MPRKKVSKKPVKLSVKKKTKGVVVTQPKRQSAFSQIATQIEWSESYVSLLIGLAVVIIASVLVIAVAKGRGTHMTQSTSSTSTVRTDFKKNLPEKYTVVSGDDLSKISEKLYNTGDRWIDIARANNIADPNNVPVGTVLTIPKLSPTPATQTASPTQTPQNGNSISGTTYTVADGDYIWDIAVRAYGDGYRAPDIINANNLQNPDNLISGMVIKIPRP